MKHTNYILALAFFFTVNLAQAQEEKQSKIGSIELGYAIISSDNEPNYNLNIVKNDFLRKFHISQNFGIASGIGLYYLSGNGFNSVGNFYHERRLIRVPLLGTLDYDVAGSSFRVISTLGLYGQVITKDKYRFQNETHNDLYNGWNFGVQFSVGLAFMVTEGFSLGFIFTEQVDFTKFTTDKDHLLHESDKQRIKHMVSVGVLITY